MPFDFKAYDAKCLGLTPEELQREWEHYTRLISGASTSTAVSGLAIPFTLGVSTIGVAMAAPAIHNARKKRDIIERHLQRHGATHVTRKRDVLGSMAVSGTIGVVTLGVGTAGADAIATAGAEHGISAIVENDTAIKVVTHAALDGVGMGVEHAHTSHLKKKDAFKAFQAAGVFQAVQDAKAAEHHAQQQQYHHHQQQQQQQAFYPYSQSQPQYLPAPPYQPATSTGFPPSQPSSSYAPSFVTTYNPAYQDEKQGYHPAVTNQPAPQQHVPQQHVAQQQVPQHPAQQQSHEPPQSYTVQPPPHEHAGQTSTLPATGPQQQQQQQQQAQVPPPPSPRPASTYTPPTPSQGPPAYGYQQHAYTPAPAYGYSFPPPPPPPGPPPQQSQHSYQPMAAHHHPPPPPPPPPSYPPPPASSTVYIHPPQQQQQQKAPEPQYAPVPIPVAYNLTPDHTAHQQHPPTPAQQGYQPAPQPYHPQPYQPQPYQPQQQQQQQQQQTYNPLTTPVSPPNSVLAAAQAQGASGYFPAVTATQQQQPQQQHHVAYDPQKWNAPYTPAATPGTPYIPQASPAQPAYPAGGAVPGPTPTSQPVAGYGTG
ncbi:hypothetical protein QIS74_13048 [Colletotrichum tabaci]|uniref:Uncharacterized protein n=1 Tax=Colletotrichum tabaci TaxID=1209068 RepID=A0AAV9SY91_9PEZI